MQSESISKFAKGKNLQIYTAIAPFLFISIPLLLSVRCNGLSLVKDVLASEIPNSSGKMIKSKNINFFLASTGDNAFLSQSCDRIAKAQGNVLHWAKKNKRALITVDTNYCENITLDTVPTQGLHRIAQQSQLSNAFIEAYKLSDLVLGSEILSAITYTIVEFLIYYYHTKSPKKKFKEIDQGEVKFDDDDVREERKRVFEKYSR
ncbi:uncharacterized protein OCT59_015410 [Rhizophagus irregularis]|uniref:uncharacterized protein n=1 Tax=Rhizophagus irregularis TaxID=588596 RepID=UPI00331A03DE|nr:hypothetical protein OCT59_015410 [Rhizophagus irregularis]